MAKNDEAPNTTPAANSSVTELANAIAGAVREGQAQKKVTYAQLKRRSVFNPKGERRRDRDLPGPVFQNGARININRLFPEEIAGLKELWPLLQRTRGIHCVDDLVHCYLRGIDGKPQEIHFAYNTKAVSDRFQLTAALAARGGGFKAMVQAALAVATEKVADDEPTRGSRRSSAPIPKGEGE